MYILFGWGRNIGQESLKYEVSDYNLTLVSSEEFAGKLGNCVPNQLSVSLEIPASQTEKPASEIFKFAKNQHDQAKNDGAGKIVIYEGREVGQPIQEVTFSKAWISDITSNTSRHDQTFQLHLTINAAQVQVSGVDYTNQQMLELVK